MKIAFMAAWICFAIELLFVAGMFITKNVGDDAAGRGMATGFGIALLPVVFISGALLYWGQNSPSRVLQWTALVVAAIPFLIGGGLWVNNVMENIGHRAEAARAGRFPDSHLTEIARAIDRKDYKSVQTLLKQRATVDWQARDAHDATLLGHAVNRVLADYSGDTSIDGVRLLLAAGAPPADGATRPGEPLLETILNGNSPGSAALLEAVLNAGANANARCGDGLPLVHITNAWHGLDKLKSLAAHGADLQAKNNRKDRYQWTALMNAAYMQDWEVALYLLDQGVSADYQAPDGKTLATVLAERSTGYVSYGEMPPPGFAKLQTALTGRRSTR